MRQNLGVCSATLNTYRELIESRGIKQNALRGFQPLMRKHGIPQNTLDEWTSRCDAGKISVS